MNHVPLKNLAEAIVKNEDDESLIELASRVDCDENKAVHFRSYHMNQFMKYYNMILQNEDSGRYVDPMLENQMIAEAFKKVADYIKVA